MVVGALRIEVRVPASHSLKEKRSVVKSLKDQLRGRFNIAVAEVEANELWQRATVGISAVGEERAQVESLLRQVIAWVREARFVEMIRVDEEYL